MKSIFRYPGGKAKAVKYLSKYLPENFLEYRECMVGGGSLFFSIQPNVKRWINDTDVNLMAVYTALKERPTEFIKLCREIAPAKSGDPLVAAKKGREIHDARLKAKFDELIANPNADPALKYFFINRTVWAGRVNYQSDSRLYFSKSVGWDITKSDALENAAIHCKEAIITVGDFSPLLTQEGDNVLCYLDPPYVVNSHFSENSKLYANNFTIEDHERMAADVQKTKHKVIISYDDDEDGFVRWLYRGFNIYEESWAYCGSTLEVKKRGKELIITNY